MADADDLTSTQAHEGDPAHLPGGGTPPRAAAAA